MSNLDPQPSPCFALLKVEPNNFVYDKALTQPTQSIWNCNPENVVIDAAGAATTGVPVMWTPE